MIEVSYEQLIAEHGEIEEAAADILRMSRDGTDPAALATALADLRCAVEAHVAMEQALVGPVADDLRREIGTEGSEPVMEALATLNADWVAYLDRWTASRIAAEPDSFRDATLEIMPRLAARVRAESDLLYAPALRRGLVRLRRVAP